MKSFITNLNVYFKRLFSHSEQVLGKLLIDKNLTISTAESCTGGLLSSRLTDVSGSSAYIFKNFVTYSNEAKTEILGVRRDTLAQYGAVSEQCAYEMAQGLHNVTGCDIAIGITGIAGPNGDENKPVGLVFIGIYHKDKIRVKQFNFDPNIKRKNMKFLFSQAAIDLTLEVLKNN